jgi:predicted exporter
MAEMAFAASGDLMVVVHDGRAPMQARWEEFCRECHRLYVELGDRVERRAMLVVSDGGGPNVLQRAQLLKAVERLPIRTAIVSSSGAVRRIHAALQLFNARASCFDAAQFLEAMAHIRIGIRQYGEVAEVIEALCFSVPSAFTANQLRLALADQHGRLQLKLDSGIRGAHPVAPTRKSLFQRFRRGA